jgi:DNA-binding Lrp family transcriptional regulator
MISAIVLVNTDLDSQDKVIESIKLVEGVEEAHTLYGVYDLLIKIKATSFDRLKDIIKSRIKQVNGVTSSLTLMIVEDPLKA